MKLCLPVVGQNGLKEQIFDHFGSAQFFVIYDTESKDIQTVSNDNQHHTHGTCQPIGVISQYGVNAILTRGMGRKAVELLNREGVKVYLQQDQLVEEAIKRFETSQMTELTVDNACGGHGCH